MKTYLKNKAQPMRPYVVGEDMKDIDVPSGVIPSEGGMVAVLGEDKWYITPEFFQENYIENAEETDGEVVIEEELNFGEALDQLKSGERVCRKGWNGKGMFLFLVEGSTFQVNRAPLNTIYPEGTEVRYHPHIDMKTATGEIVPWLASQSDMLSADWQLLGQ